MREIVLDTETTGLDPLRGDRLVEVGCVEIVNRFITGRNFHRYVNPQRNMPIEAFQVHGLSEAFLSDKPLFASIADEFLDFIGEDTLVIHNASFDIGFLNAELKRLRKGPLAMTRVVDTLTLARRKHPGAPASLDALCARYGINNAKRTKHGALLDAEILAEVYAELTGGKQSSFGLSDLPTQASGPGQSSRIETGRATPRLVEHISLITEEERAAHGRFIEEMKDKAIWNTYLAEGAEKETGA
jgi:DNA polymerase-3 subunit epsilon